MTGMTKPYVLHYAPDNASMIIRLALDELDIAFDTCLVDRAVAAQRSKGYRALNPAGRIPTLETPDGPISETGAILLWLADRHGGLLPDPRDPMRAAALNWLFFLANTLHADAAILFYINRYGVETDHAAMRDAVRARLTAHVALIETEARPRLTGWLGARQPSALDLYLAPLLRWLQLYPVEDRGWFDLAAYPGLHAMCIALEQRQSTDRLCIAEGMGPHPFSAPDYPQPPEGSAL